MPPAEAGPCMNGQRRYLWTDSFAIVNFVSQAKLIDKLHAEQPIDNVEMKKQGYLAAAGKLIDCVFESLGAPRSPAFPMAFDSQRGIYKGLRIGKVLAAERTDDGMKYDGMEVYNSDRLK
jgi:hypothetical protein